MSDRGWTLPGLERGPRSAAPREVATGTPTPPRMVTTSVFHRRSGLLQTSRATALTAPPGMAHTAPVTTRPRVRPGTKATGAPPQLSPGCAPRGRGLVAGGLGVRDGADAGRCRADARR